MAANATFIKPEAIKARAEDFIAAGNSDDAISSLFDVITSKRFKYQQVSSGMEDMMILFFNLCIEEAKLDNCKQGLTQYRSLCNEANDPSSLEKVITHVRTASLQKVAELSKTFNLSSLNIDVDPTLAPEAVLDLVFTQTDNIFEFDAENDAVEHTETTRAFQTLRFFWETLRAILDVVFRFKSFEDVYFPTAEAGIQFCLEFNRPAELKRLCDSLRFQYQSVFKHAQSYQENAIAAGAVGAVHDPSLINFRYPKTALRLITLRQKQFEACMSLKLYREAFSLAEDIHHLLSTANGPVAEKKFVALQQVTEMLLHAQGAELVHAAAYLRQISHIRQFRANKQLAGDELSELATAATLAALAAPVHSGAPATLSLEMTDAEIHTARTQSFADLLELSTLPSRARVMTDLRRNILTHASPAAAKLFALLEDGTTAPVTVCRQVEQILAQLDAKVVSRYGHALKQNAVLVLLRSLSRVAPRVSLKKLTTAYCPSSFLSAVEVERLVVRLLKTGAIQGHVSTEEGALIFEASESVSLISAAAHAARTLCAAVAAATPASTEETQVDNERQQIYKVKDRRIKEDSNIVGRREEAMRERAKIAALDKQRKEEEAKKAAEEAKKAEEARLAAVAEEEARQREEARAQREKDSADREKRNELLKEIRDRMAKGTAVVRTVDINGSLKKLDEVSLEDVAHLSIEEIEKFVDEQAARERKERIKIRKNEARKLDHLVRALREENSKTLETVEAKNLKVDQKRAEEYRVTVEAALQEKAEKLIFLQSHLKNLLDDIEDWREAHE